MEPTRIKYNTREEWLEAAVKLMVPLFKSASYDVPKVRVSCSFPSSRGLGAKSRALGECWAAQAAADGVCQIFVSPLMEDTVDPYGVLAVLVHEVVHAVVGHEAKHGPKFAACATKVGLTGKMTSTVPSEILMPDLQAWAGMLGTYPHAKLNPTLSGKKKQTTRLRKCKCADCGYIVRTTSKWIEEVGAPHCPVHGEMKVEEPTEGSEEAE